MSDRRHAFAPSAPPRKRRLLIGFATGLLIVAAVLAAALAAGFYTDGGRTFIARRAVAVASKPGERMIAFETVGGHWPGEITIRGLTVADGEGIWLTIEDARIVWRPLRALAGALDFQAVEVSGVDILRRPVALPDKPPSKSTALPSNLTVEALSVDALTLRQPVIGQEARLIAAAHVRIRNGEISGVLSAERLDRPGTLNVKGAVMPGARSLDMELAAAEPPGGLVAAALSEPDAGALSVAASVRGTFDALEGQLDAALEGYGSASAQAKGGLGDGKALDVSAALRLEDALVLPAAGDLGRDLVAGFTLRQSVGGSMEVADLEARAGNGSASGRVLLGPAAARSGRALEGAIKIALRRPMAPAAGGVALAGDTALDMDLAGTLAAPRLDLSLDAQGLDVGGVRILDLAFAVRAERGGPGADAVWSLDATGGAAGATGRSALADALRGGGQLALSAQTDAEGGMAVSAFAVETPTLSLTGSGAVAGRSRALSGIMKGRVGNIAAFSALAKGVSGGALDVESTLGGSFGAPEADLLLAITNLRLADGRLDAGLGGDWTGHAQMRRQDGRLAVSDISIRADTGAITASGSLVLSMGDEAAIEGEIEADLVSVAPFVGDAGAAFDAAVTAAVTVGGAIGSEIFDFSVTAHDAAFEGRALGGAVLAGKVARDGQAFAGPVTLTSDEPWGRIDLAGSASAGGGAFGLRDLRGEALGLGISGDLSAGDGGLVAASAVDAPDLRSLSPLLAQVTGDPRSLSEGSLRLRIDMDGERRTASAQAENVLVVLGETLDIGVNALALSARTSPAGVWDLVAEAAGLRSGGRNVEAISVTAGGPREAVAITAEASGFLRPLAKVKAVGSLNLAEEKAALSALDVALPEGQAKLQNPIALAWRSGIAAGPAAWAFSDPGGASLGTVGFDFARGPRGTTAHLKSTDLDIEVLKIAVPLGPVEGTINVEADIDTAARLPAGHVKALLSARAITGPKTADPPIEISLDADWQERLATVRSRIDYDGATLGRSQAVVSVGQSSPGALPAVRLDDPMSGSFDFDGPLKALTALLPGWDAALSGTIVAKFALMGTPRAPRLDGALSLAGGRFDHFGAGLLVEDINGSARFSDAGQSMMLTGRDTNGGTATLTVDFPDQASLRDLRGKVELNRFRVARREDAEFKVSGAIGLDPDERGWIARGELVVDEGQVRIPKSLPPSIVVVPVRERKGEIIQSPPPKKASIPLVLDLSVSAKRPVVVSGRGLRSNWTGAVGITGTTAEPRVEGEMNLQDGTFKFGGQPFTLTEGRIRFDGGATIDPRLHVRAEYEAETDVTAILEVTGTTKNPIVSVSSSPSRPQDTVLALILFGKQPSELTTGELVQLGYAVSSVSGALGGGGILTQFETVLGLDVFDVGYTPGTEGGGAGGVSVSVGKRVSEKVFVSVKRGGDAASSRVAVDLDLTDHIAATTQVRQDGESSVGLTWSIDY